MDDAYSVLGLSNAASFSDVKRVYHRLALRTHPDKGGDAEAFKAIGAAFATISSNQPLIQF